MSKTDNLHDFLVDIADAVRSKTGKTEPINAQNLSSEIRSIESGEVHVFGGTMVDKTGCGIANTNIVNVLDGITDIGDRAYYYLPIEQINLPQSIKTFGTSVFEGNEKIQEFTIPTLVDRIKTRMFYNCKSLKHARLNNVKYIEDRAFCYCTSLEDVNLEGVKTLGINSFYGCASFLEIIIPDSVTSLGSGAFADCSNAEKIVIGSGVPSIGSLTFSNMTSCKYFVFSDGRDEIPTLLSKQAFNGTTGKIVVPDTLYDEWIAATNWSSIASKIVKASEYNG